MKMLRKVSVLSLALSCVFSLNAFAGVWTTDSGGWWYRYYNGSYPSSKWLWIDGNSDGVSECYYFDSRGYLVTNGRTPDGYYVDSDGKWVDGGRIQTMTRARRIGEFRQNWIYGTYERHDDNGITTELTVGWYSGSGEDYIDLEITTPIDPYYSGRFTGVVKSKNGNEYIAYGSNDDYVKFVYEGDRIVIKDNSIYNSGEEFIGFVGFFDKVEDMSENVS